MTSFSISGIVEKHLGRGRQLGFPTANIAYDGPAKEGVYAARIILHPQKETQHVYDAVAFIGSAPTFNDTKKRLEVYIFDFDQNIYGEYVSVELIMFLRENRKYDSAQGLIDQIHLDIQETKKVLLTK